MFHPLLDDAAIKAEADSVLDLISRFGGVVDKIDNQGRKKLAYEINKLFEGVYSYIDVSANSDFPKELESRLRIRENIIRFLIIRDERPANSEKIEFQQDEDLEEVENTTEENLFNAEVENQEEKDLQNISEQEINAEETAE